MPHIEKMHEECEEFKAYVTQTMDLMVDSYKWKKLCMHSTSESAKARYKHISEELYNLYEQEYHHAVEIFKEV